MSKLYETLDLLQTTGQEITESMRGAMIWFSWGYHATALPNDMFRFTNAMHITGRDARALHELGLIECADTENGPEYYSLNIH